MAASSLNAVRVKLYFDYPPPSMPDCRMSWVLLDLNQCRVVADLCSVIREKFDYSRQTGLDLFIENCFLPPAESVYVVRDNDSVRVKVSSVSCEHAGRKRIREDEGLFQAPTKKNRHEPSEVNGVTQPTGATKKKKKHKAKKKKGEKQQVESGDASKTTVPAKEPSSSKSQTDKSSKRASASSVLTNGKAIPSGEQNDSPDSSDSSEEVTRKPSPAKSKQAQVAASKPPASQKNSSSDSSSSEDEKVPVKKSPKPSVSSKTCTSTKTPKAQSSCVTPKSITNSLITKKTQKRSSSDSSSDEAPAAARNAKVPAKSTNPALKTQPLKPVTAASSSSSSEEDSRKGSTSGKTSSGVQKSLTSKIPTPKKPSGSSKKSKTPSSSDSSSSSEAETCKANLPATPKPSKTSQAQTQPCSDSHAVIENGGTTPPPSTPIGTRLQDTEDKADGSSSSDTELLIKRPNPHVMAGLTPWGRGRGIMDKAKGRGGVRGGFGRARGTPWKQNFHYNYDNGEQRKQNEIQTNKSMVLQNPPEPSPRRDYSTLPLLAAPPAVGQKIVFKLLELTENYTPEVSDYKEGKIIGFDHSTKMIELQLLTHSQTRTEPGKFDLVYQNSDGSERVEYAVTSGSQLTERWESLLEPRLIVQNAD